MTIIAENLKGVVAGGLVSLRGGVHDLGEIAPALTGRAFEAAKVQPVVSAGWRRGTQEHAPPRLAYFRGNSLLATNTSPKIATPAVTGKAQIAIARGSNTSRKGTRTKSQSQRGNFGAAAGSAMSHFSTIIPNTRAWHAC